MLTIIRDITPCNVLQTARKQGDFLLVGLHGDEDITERRGPHLPLMDLHERSLSVLACKYVDEVVIGAPPPSAKPKAASRRPTIKVYSAPLSVPACKNMTRWSQVHAAAPRASLTSPGGLKHRPKVWCASGPETQLMVSWGPFHILRRSAEQPALCPGGTWLTMLCMCCLLGHGLELLLTQSHGGCRCWHALLAAIMVPGIGCVAHLFCRATGGLSLLKMHTPGEQLPVQARRWRFLRTC